MKKYLLAFIFLFISSGTLFCQIDFFTAKDGLDFLNKNVSSLNNFELVSIVSMEIPLMPILQVDIDNSKCNNWTYAYKSKDKNDTAAYLYVVLKNMGVYTDVLSKDDTTNLQGVPALSSSWVNSDVIFKNILKNEFFMNYYKANSSSIDFKLLGLTNDTTGMLAVRGNLSVSNEFWMLEAASIYDPMIASLCIYSAESGNVIDCKIATAVMEAVEKILSVYPNPSSDRIRFDVPFTGQADLKITNLFGQVVISETRAIDQSTDINIADLPAGTYIVRLTYGKNVYVNKLQVVR